MRAGISTRQHTATMKAEPGHGLVALTNDEAMARL